MSIFTRFSYVEGKGKYLVLVYEAEEFDAYLKGKRVEVLDVDEADTPEQAQAKGQAMIALRSWEPRQ